MNKNEALSLLESLIARAKKQGADEAEAMLVSGASCGVSWREGGLESLENSDGEDIGLRVFIGKKQASVSSTDKRPEMLENLVERAVAMARIAPEDPFAGLAAPDEIARVFPTLEMSDPTELAPEILIERAKAAEDAARAVKGVTLVDSTDASASRTSVAMAFSNGFSGGYERTHYGLSASVVAGEGNDKVSDYDYAVRVFDADLPSAEKIGTRAGERTVRSLAPRKMPTCRVPVVFDPREASGLLGTFAGAVSGSSIARGSSFLKEFLGKQVFSDSITIQDDPFRPRGLRTRLFDGEGLAPSPRAIVEKGVLQTWFLDLRSARQLGLKSTGHASRSVGGVPSPSPTNLFIEAGSQTPEALMKSIGRGFYVTRQMGMGINGVTGDYSQAASGLWIEDGVPAFAVNEMTIAGNMKDMFRSLVAANDLEYRRGVDSPTLLIEAMTVAGS